MPPSRVRPDAARGNEPFDWYVPSSVVVASFACLTLGSSNGLISRSAPAIAVAISQRTNSAPRAAGSQHATESGGCRPVDGGRRGACCAEPFDVAAAGRAAHTGNFDEHAIDAVAGRIARG